MNDWQRLFPVPPRSLSEAQFVDLFGGVYEHTPSVAQLTWRTGLNASHDTVEGLANALADTVNRMNKAQLLALINAHPDLAGKAAVAGELTAHSTHEQSAAGIDQCTPEEFERFVQLNDAYRKKFGFTFVMAVKGSDRQQILENFAERLENNADTEFTRAIAEIHKIARFRLRAIAAQRNLCHPFARWINLAQPRLGSEVVFATDDFFADKSRLIDPSDPVFIPDRFDDNGKWMDGWESRRKRTPGHDYCIIRLGVPGVIHGVEIDTSHFTGNYPPAASIDACISSQALPSRAADWQNILPKIILHGDARRFEPIRCTSQFTHVRFNIFPDGGVARLRIFGEVQPDWSQFPPEQLVDLLAVENGGKALMCNDEHFGTMHNLNAPGRGINMGDGWETARRRVPGNDWVILALGHPGTVQSVVVDTAHFKGNYPDRVSLRGTLLTDPDLNHLAGDSLSWPELLPAAKLTADNEHTFAAELKRPGPISHVRVDIYPDGGISRLRLFGHLHRTGRVSNRD